jgi:alpha-L-fucosidase
MQYNSSRVTLRGYKGKIKYAQFLHDNSEIKISQAEDNSNDLVLKLPQRPNMEIPVIELALQ